MFRLKLRGEFIPKFIIIYVILCMILCLTLMACGKEDNPDKQTDNITNQQKPDLEENDRIPDNEIVVSNTVDNGPNSSDYATDDPVEEPSLKQGENKFVGAIGDSKIHMNLDYNDGVLAGSYYHDKDNLPATTFKIAELGRDQKDYVSLFLIENTDLQGMFLGIFKSSDYIVGLWQWDTNGEMFPFYLIREGSEEKVPIKPTEKTKKFDGNWYGVNSSYHNRLNLKISVLFDDLLFYESINTDGSPYGVFRGLATCENGIAKGSCTELREFTPSKEYVSLEMQTDTNNELILSSDDISLSGLDSTLDRRYTKEPIDVVFPTLLEVGIVDNKDQEERFLKILNYRDFMFIENTQYVEYKSITLDGQQVYAGEGYVKGERGNTFYINAGEYMYAAIYDDDLIEYFTNNPNYANAMPDILNDWASQYDAEIVYNNISGPWSFDKEIPDIIIKQIDKIVSGKEISLPDNYSMLDYCIGDLDEDGDSDIAVVIQQGEAFYTGSRRIYVFLSKNGSYELTFENKDLILGRNEGGIFGDPYSSISIPNDGKLVVEDYGGSSDRWGHDYIFKYKKGDLNLASINSINHNSWNLNGIKEVYDLTNNTMEIRTVQYETSEIYDDLILCSGKIKSVNIPFQAAYAGCEVDLIEESIYSLMPSLGSFEYGDRGVINSSYKAVEILDKVMRENYSHMNKVDFPLTNKMIENYSLLVGYDIVPYYYSDSDSTLVYYDMYINENEIQHIVLYRKLNDRVYIEGGIKFIYISDETGELIK